MTTEVARDNIPGFIDVKSLEAPKVTKWNYALSLGHHEKNMPPTLRQDQALLLLQCVILQRPAKYFRNLDN
jgi:hypothetical protein